MWSSDIVTDPVVRAGTSGQAVRRQPYICCGQSCQRRATSESRAPGISVSSTIRAFCCADQRRRSGSARPTPCLIIPIEHRDRPKPACDFDYRDLERDAAVSERDALLTQNDRLRHLLLKLTRMHFGGESERLPEEQLQLGSEALEQTSSSIPRNGAAFIKAYENLVNHLAADELFGDALHLTHAMPPVLLGAKARQARGRADRRAAKSEHPRHDRSGNRPDPHAGGGGWRRRVDAASTIMLLMATEAMYPGKRMIHLFLDNAHYHRAMRSSTYAVTTR